MFARFDRQCAAKERLERNSRAERAAQIYLLIAKEAGPQASVGCEPDSIAVAAVSMRHRCNHADRYDCAPHAVIARRAVPAHWADCGGNRRTRPESLHTLLV